MSRVTESEVHYQPVTTGAHSFSAMEPALFLLKTSGAVPFLYSIEEWHHVCGTVKLVLDSSVAYALCGHLCQCQKKVTC